MWKQWFEDNSSIKCPAWATLRISLLSVLSEPDKNPQEAGLISLQARNVALRFDFLASRCVSALHPRQEGIHALLNRSEELYYEARFKESVDLLTALEITSLSL